MKEPSQLTELLLDQDLLHLKITLNRPEKKNALSQQMIKELKQVFLWAKESENVKVISISGAGSAFCSGADLSYLKEMRQYNYEKNLKDSQALAELFLTIYRFPKPVIAKVKGAALAGGCGLATICDFVIATESSIFGYPEVKIGFVPALVSTFLIRQVGERHAKYLLLSGKLINAKEAFEIGLIDRCVDSEKIDNELNELVNILLNNSLTSMTVTKSLFNSFNVREVENELKNLSEINAKHRETEDFYEGITSFLEKRKPNWVISPKKGE